MFLFMGGIQHPIPSAISGAVWILGEIIYSRGYDAGGTCT